MTKGKALFTKVAVLFSAFGIFNTVFASPYYLNDVKNMELVFNKNILLDYNQYYENTGPFRVDVEATIYGTNKSSTTPVIEVKLDQKSGWFDYKNFKTCTIKVSELRKTYSCEGTQSTSGTAKVRWQNTESGSSLGGAYSAYSVYYTA